MNDPRNQSIDPNNPAHHHGLGLPASYYANIHPPREPRGEEAAMEKAYREEFQRRKAAGMIPKVFP